MDEAAKKYAINQFENIINENENLRRWVNDLQSGMYINCVYCGHRYGPKKNTPVSMSDVLKEHIEKCEKHPLVMCKRDLERVEVKLFSTQRRVRELEEENEKLTKMAYIGEHHFPDNSWKARLNELKKDYDEMTACAEKWKKIAESKEKEIEQLRKHNKYLVRTRK